MRFNSEFKGLNADLNIICHFLALLGAHPIFHVCRIRVKAMKIFVNFFLNSGGYYNYPERIIKKQVLSMNAVCMATGLMFC